MVKLKAFLSLERSAASTMQSVMSQVASTAMDKLLPLLEAGKWDDAHDIANRLSLNGVVEEQRRRLEELAVSALLFGAQNVAGSPSSTSFVRGTQPIPWALQQALDQLTDIVETAGGEQMRQAIHDLVRSQEITIQKADQSLVDMLNAAVMGTGKMVVDIGANLTTSRLVTLGFLSEAMDAKIDTYQINEVLDSRTCPVCQYMHGKTFRVEQEFSRVLTAIGTADPKELKSIAPWPSASKAGLTQLNGMSLGEMQAAGYGSPPFHPGCRGVLALTGTITETIPLGKLKIAQAVQQIVDAVDEPVPVTIAPVGGFTLEMIADAALRGKIAQITNSSLQLEAIEAFVNGNLARVHAILVQVGLETA
jgi:hypothetical protein